MNRAARNIATLALTVCALLAAGCVGHTSPLPYYRTPTLTPEWLADAAASAPTMHRVAPFRLTDQRGSVISNATFAGHVSVVQFFFTQCGDVCPTTTSNLARLLRSVPDSWDIQILSHSVKPDRDSEAVLRAYAVDHGINDPRWHLLTGSADDIRRLARDSYFVRLGDGATYGVATIEHTESVLLVDGCGRLRGVYAGTLALEMQRLRDDAQTLMAEACTGRS